MTADPSDGRSVIDTRTLALLVGCLSLGFGIWAATGAASEVGLAAGALGLVAGLISLVPTAGRARGNRIDSTDTSQGAAHGSDEAPGDPAGDASRPAAKPPDARIGAGRHPTPGFFDRDPDRDVSDVGGPDGNGPDGGVPDSDGDDDSPDLASTRSGCPVETATTAGAGASSELAMTGAVPAEEADPPASAAPLTDPATGLFSEEYLVVALEGRLASARRHLRPVALAVLQVCQGLPDSGSRPAEPEVVAGAITDTVRDSDIACRLGDGTFGVILEDTPENGAVWTVERIRRNLVSSRGHHTLWAGVACYPAHGFDVAELMTQVRVALDAAKEWNQDRIEVAIAE